jgi:hypothetical protein
MGRYDGDVDILTKVVEEAEEALKGKVLEVAAEKQGNFGLADFEDCGNPFLSQFAFFNDLGDFPSKLGFGKSLFRIVNAEVGEYIP